MHWSRSNSKQGQNMEKQSGSGGANDSQQLKTEIQQIIRDELKQIIAGDSDAGQRGTRVHGNQRFRVKKPIKVGQGSAARQNSPCDPVVRHDIELLTQVQMELAAELAENLKQLRTVIAESQSLAERIQAVLGQSKTPE